MVARMSGIAARLVNSSPGFALIVAAVLCLGGKAAHAQSLAEAQAAPVGYWTPGWPLGFGGTVGEADGSGTYANFPGFDGRDSRFGGFSYARYNFPNGWFVGSERGELGLMGGLGQSAAFGSFGSSQGVQFGYNFQNTPVTVYAGFDTVKYNTGIGNPFTSSFDSSSSTLSGYSANVGIEFKPTSNVSVSLGMGYTQQPSGTINSLPVTGTSPYSLVGHQ
jgi:opacity protein-like surface antigen